jgi:hypothetical protein
VSGPPFAPHPTSADAIRAHAEGLAIYAGGSYRLAGDVRHAFAAARSGVGGALDEPMQQAPQRFFDAADRLHLAVMYAAGCITLFADAVRAFDAGVSDLNTDWEAACGSDFGVVPVSPDAARTPHGIDATHLAELESDWAAAVDAARRELAADLRRRHHRLEGRLDEAAHDIARRLRRGPTHDGVRALVGDGAFRQLYGALEHRLFQLTPDPQPSAIETLQESGRPYICDAMGCRPTYTLPGDDPSDSGDFGNIGDLAAGIIGGFTETVDMLIPNELPAALPPNPGGHVVDLPDQPLTDSYEELARDVGINTDSDLYTIGTWGALPSAAGVTKLGVKLSDSVVLRYARRTATDEATDAADDVTGLVLGSGLAAHEGPRAGHTLRDHVDLDAQDLIDRIRNGANEASTFTNREIAESAIHDVLKANDSKIRGWLSAGGKPWLTMNESTNKVLGRYVDSATLQVRDAKNIRVVIYKDPSLQLGYYIKTAFPRP